MKKGVVIFIVIVLVGINVILYNFYIRPLLNMPAQNEQSLTGTKTTNNSGSLAQTGLEVKTLHIIGSGKNIILTVEVAKTFSQRTIGLMFRDTLAADHGMIFMFDDEVVRSFWMKNTYIGLDLLFVSKDGLIKHIHKNALPEDLTTLPSKEPVQYVIEVNKDYAEKNNIQIGDKVEGIK